MPVLNLAAFTAAVEKAGKDVPAEQVQELQRHMGLAALKGVVFETPVDTGRARGNWQATIGAQATSVLDVEDKEGSSTISANEGTVLSAKPYTVTWITNNLPYIEVLEFGLFDPPNPGPSKQKRQEGKTLVKGGFSRKAPGGMVRITLARLEKAFP